MQKRKAEGGEKKEPKREEKLSVSQNVSFPFSLLVQQRARGGDVKRGRRRVSQIVSYLTSFSKKAYEVEPV